MPDLISHIGSATLLSRLKLQSYYPYLLIGSILPDIPAAFSILNKVLLKQPSWVIYLYTASLQGLLPMLAFGIIFALLFKETKAVFLGLSMGIVLHFLLDVLQNTWGNGLLLFYPFYYGDVGLDVFTYGSLVTDITVISVLILLLIVVYFQERKYEIAFTSKKIPFVILILGGLATLPWLTKKEIIDTNVLQLYYLSRGTYKEGSTIEFQGVTIDNLSKDSTSFTIDTMGHIFTALPSEKEFEKNVDQLRNGMRIDLKGLYQKNQIIVQKINYRNSFISKSLSSLAGLLVLLLMMIRMLRFKRSSS